MNPKLPINLVSQFFYIVGQCLSILYFYTVNYSTMGFRSTHRKLQARQKERIERWQDEKATK